MGTTTQKHPSTASQITRVLDQVLGIARSEHARATVTGSSKPHVTITKHATDFNDTYFRSMLSGIEFATRGHFGRGAESVGYTEWILRSPLIDVTVRGTSSTV